MDGRKPFRRNRRQIYIPGGFAHGFCVVSESALVAYKCTDVYRSDLETAILWSDSDIGIDWPIGQPVVSPKDGDLIRTYETEFVLLSRQVWLVNS